MENIFVSVIMPVFNAQDTIEESINSVLSQTLKNIELICIDDGSSDLSMQIINKYATDDERVIAISQPNKGSGAARNAGIDIARGEYICFMDSDDYYPYGDTLEVLYNTAVDNNVNICGGSFSELKDGKLETKWNGLKGKYSFDYDGITFYKSYQFDYGYQRFIYDREFLNRNNIRFPDYRRFQDPPFFVKAMIAADKFYAMKRTSYVYRVGGFDRVVWTQEKLLHMLSGLTDLLKMSSEHRLKELHNQTITRVITTYMKLLNENRNFLNSLRDKLRDFVFLIDKNLFDEEISNEMFFHKLLMIAGVSLDEFLNIKTAEEKNMTVLRTAISSLKSCREDNDASEPGKPLVTVVIPVYNVEEFIGDCLSTVIDQTYGNLEILCVNDGSPDNSVSIISEYQKADKRIVILNKENGGLSSARNYGIEHASGKYIVFLDSDDYYEQNALKRMVETAESNHADLVHFNARPFYESAEMYAAFKHYSTFYQRKESYYGLYENGSLFGKLIEKNDFKTSAWLNFARTDYIRSKNIDFYEGIIHEDNLFSPLVLIMAEKCVCLDEVFYVRRIREDSIITKGKSLNNVVGLFTCAAELARFNQVSNLSFEISEALKEWIYKLIRESLSLYDKLKKEYGADTSEVTGKLFKTDDKVLFELLSAQIIKEDTQKSQDKRSAAMPEKKSEKTTLYFDYGPASDNNSTELRSFGSESRRAVGFVATKPNGVKVFNPLIMHTGNKNWVTPFELEDETKLLKKEIEELKKQLELFKVKD